MVPTSENPYAAPQTFDTPSDASTEAELIRKEHLHTEASFKTIGFLYCLGGVVLVSLGIMPLIFGIAFGRLVQILIGTLLVALGAAHIVVGTAIRRPAPWSRVPAIILSGIGLLAFPIGTVIYGYILYLVLGKNGKMVLSAPYQEIIAATPDVKCPTPTIVWVIFGIIVAVMALAIITGLMS